MNNYAHLFFSGAVIVGAGLMIRTCLDHYSGSNIGSGYIEPENIKVRRLDINHDGFDETILQWITPKGEKRTFDLTHENLGKILEE